MITNYREVPFESPRFVTPKKVAYTQNGVEKEWELVEVHDSVAILLVDREKEAFVVVKQFRPPVYLKANGGFTYELCAGILDKGKTPEETALEEVDEECGYQVGPEALERITAFYTAVGFGGSEQILFMAYVDEAHRIHGGGGVDIEEIEVVHIPFAEANAFMMDESKPKTPGLLFAFQWYLSTHI